MISLEKILKFRNEKEPLFSSWHYNGHTLYGALIWRGAQPVLQLLLEIDYGGDIDELEKSDPFLAATKPPNKVTFLGRHPKHGPISVCSSMRSAWSRSLKFETGRATYHIEFLPESIWLGAPLEEIDGSIEGATARDFRLAGFFGVPGLERVSPYGEEAKEKFEAFGSPKEIWLWNGPSEWLIPMGESGFSFGVNTSVTSGTSATIGYTLQSTVDLHVHSKEPATIAQFKEKIFGLEQIISHYSIESFSFLSEEFHTKDGRSAILAWQLGEGPDLFTPPMFHQVLANFAQRDTIETIFADWFNQSETVRLSRWLFTRSLKETGSGLARFVAVAQAFEVLGREHGPTPKITRSENRDRLKKFRALIKNNFDQEFIDRADRLISSSNSNSFQDMITHMIGHAVEYYRLGKKEDVSEICKKFSRLRNTIVHMSDNSEGQLNEAFSTVNKMSLRISFFYLLVQAHIAQLPLEPGQVQQFLFNNRNARHGLDNEVLEGA